MNTQEKTMRAQPRPLFIVLEGLDGCGKSTLAALLAKELDATLLSTPLEELSSFRPGVDRVFGPNGLARSLWYAAHVAKASDLATKSIESGRSVVLDRYWMSTLAYARCEGCRLELTEVLDRLRQPDLTLFLSLERRIRKERLHRRGQLKAHDLCFLDPVMEDALYDAFRELGQREDDRFLEIILPESDEKESFAVLLQALARPA